MRKFKKTLIISAILLVLVLNIFILFSPVSARPPQWFIEQNPYGFVYQGQCIPLCAPVGDCGCW